MPHLFFRRTLCCFACCGARPVQSGLQGRPVICMLPDMSGQLYIDLLAMNLHEPALTCSSR